MKGFFRTMIATGMLIATVTLTSAVGVLAFPHRAYAVPSEVVVDTPRFAEWLLKALQKIGENAMLTSVTTALINTVTYAADRLAYDAAVFIASGGDGDSPLFENRTIGEYFADYGASVAADALGQIDESGILGNFSLCEPKLPEVTLAFKFGIQGAFQRPEPTCKFSEVQENWGAFRAEIQAASLTPNEENSLILTTLADAYNPKSNDFSVGILLYTDVLNKAQQDASLAAQRKLFGGFFEDKTDFITGRVETPAEVLQDNFRTAFEGADDTRRDAAIQTLGDSNVLLQIGIHAGSVFTNTLLSKFTEKLYSGLFGGLDQSDINPFDVSGLAGTQDARETYRSFLTASVLSVENYSLLDDFSACPYVGKGLYNCVADSSLIAAVSRADGGIAMTIAEAMEDGLLHGSWPLIPSSDTARDQDMYCYTYGYCHGNLVKLRKARIISTGWELAAESAANTESSPVTLEEVVNGFYECNEQNELDDNHPWCHLIDPNWVLKYPETQCKNQAYGQILESSASDQRKTECVDMPSCIDEDGDGNCTGGYGYCVREENVWNFRGEECPEYYGSCTSYENPDGDQVDFLSNTTDPSVCTADSAGCLWYSTEKTSTDNETYDWPTYTDATVFAAAEGESDVYRNRIYFTSAVEDCAADDAGCRELVSRKNGTTLNMIANPSFEKDENEDGIPDGWFLAGTGETYNAGGDAVLDGTDAINPGNSGVYYQRGIVVTPAAEYTLSFYAAQNAGAATSGVQISFEASNGESVDFRGYRLDGDCAIDSANVNTLDITGTPASADYTRYSCVFTVPTLADARAELTAMVTLQGADLWFDAVQLEQESAASDFHEEYSDAVLDLAYVKVPPTYLGCTGTDADPAACDDYAGICSEGDVGCSAYSPTNGDPQVIGIAGALDACPAECVGYDTFKQEPTRYEPAGDFPIYFIPDSAEQCTAQYVGCDEFTNITTEEPSYFTYVRACVTPEQADANTSTSDAGAIFYTWEGSDTDGYQLKTWNLLESDMNATLYAYASGVGGDIAPHRAPCTTWSTNDEGISCQDDSDGDGILDADTESCDEHDDTITNPDCREFYDTEGTMHYREWTDTVTVNDACVTYRKTTIVGADSATQTANCENSGGYFDDVTAQCRYYGYAEESFSCPAAESGCREYTGGRSRNSRQAFVEYFEDDALTQWDAGSATDVTLSNESIATDGHSLFSDNAPVWTYVGGDGAACTDAGGCESATGTLGATCVLAEGETYCGTLAGEVFTGKTYVVSFWAKGSGTLSVGFDTSRTSGTAAIDASFAAGSDAITLGPDWQQYSYGPKYMDASSYPDFGNGASALVFTPGSGASFYIDNVVLREGEDNIDVIQNSWVTPASCDETEGGIAAPQYMLGCQEYTDQNGDVANLKSFTELCDESKVGCEAYFMTQESDAVTGAVYGALCSTIDGAPVSVATSCYAAQNSAGTAYDVESNYLCTIGVAQASCEFNLDWYVPAGDLAPHLSYVASTVISPADRDIFLIVSNDVECSSDVAGCTEVGLPVFVQDHSAVESWETTYLMNVPGDYSSTLCSQDELFCQEWADNEGNVSYFKDPQGQTCEYFSDVTVSGVTYNGWFKTGTNELCDPEYVIGGDESGIWRNGDDAYAGWVGTCASQYDTCSEFQDLADLATEELYGNADGTSYYYMNNDALEENSLPDSQKCNGEVSQTDGCGIFNDTADPRKTANASATYIASAHADALFGLQPNDFVSPIDCEGDSTIIEPDGDIVDLCNNRCVYPPETYYDITSSSTGEVVMDGSCYSNEDCRPLTSQSGETVNGSCLTNLAWARLENDSNTVLKVNRDRECSEWLSCSDSLTTWDERTNSYVTICGDIGLCTEYSGTSDASFCSAWKDSGAAVPLNIQTYASRDVSWYGDDYSGFAIPNVIPVDQLTQVNVAEPKLCDTEDSGIREYIQYHGDVCEDDSDCGASGTGSTYCKVNDVEDYRLAYVAGSCSGYDFNQACSVGYCENSGSACISTEACGAEGGTCLIGACYAVSTNICASSADCDSGQSCLSGYCATDRGDAAIEDYTAADPNLACSTGETFYPSVNFKTGTCMYDQCILTPSGSTFDINTSEAMTCRAYPEINSPFENAIVEMWQDPTDYSVPLEDHFTITESNISDLDATPVSFVQNFENVQTCAWGEDCSCSYKKVAYGGSATVRYFGDDVNDDALDFGICTSGLTGSFCLSDDECDGGTCEFPSQIDDAMGLDGYCLERDSSTNILGDRDLRACLTWLPVDQLAGATDLYAKYTEAGYFAETNYCAYVGAYADLTPSIANGADEPDKNWSFGQGAEILCAGGTDSYVRNPYCQDDPFSMTCPAGYFAVVGPRWNDSEYGDSDKDTFTFTCSKDGGRNDCPYICVPYDAVHEETGDACEPDEAIMTRYPVDHEGWNREHPGEGESYDYTYPVYTISDVHEFTDYAVDAQLCKAYGRQITNINQETIPLVATVLDESSDYFTTSTAADPEPYGVQDSATQADMYMACSTVFSTMNSMYDNGAAPYTDRILNTARVDDTLNAATTTDAYFKPQNFAYTVETLQAPFGASVLADVFNGIDDKRPARLPSCKSTGTEATDKTMQYIYSSPDVELGCETGTTQDNSASFTNPEARAFTDYYFTLARLEEFAGSEDVTPGRVHQVQSQTYVVAGPGTYNCLSDAGDAGSTLCAVGMVADVFARGRGGIRFYDGVYDRDNNVMLPQEEWSAGFYEPIDVSAEDENIFEYDRRATDGNAPSVWALDLNNCYNDVCEEDEEHALTLNEQNEGDVEANEFFRAYLKFYAAADKNQLPLRRVIVDWGDGMNPTGSSDDNNYYKNHRGLEDGTEISICDKPASDSDYEWGMSPESCDQNYFSYNHIYTCNPSQMPATCDDGGDDGIIDNTPCTIDETQCVYRPRVHIRDNWGLCTGTCDSTWSSTNSDRGPECIDMGDFEDMNNTELTNECDYTNYTGNATDSFDISTNPWVYYDGMITVTP